MRCSQCGEKSADAVGIPRPRPCRVPKITVASFLVALLLPPYAQSEPSPLRAKANQLIVLVAARQHRPARHPALGARCEVTKAGDSHNEVREDGKVWLDRGV